MYRITAALAGIIFVSACGVIGTKKDQEERQTKIIIECKECKDLVVTKKRARVKKEDDLYISPSVQ